MREHLYIGPTPCEESCAQVGSHDYSSRARKECDEFVEFLRRHFGSEPDGALLIVKSNPHDFGEYLEVICSYDPEIQESVDYAFKVEGNTPAEWDNQARTNLRAAGLLLKGDDEVEEDW